MKSHNTYWNQQIVSLIMLWMMIRIQTTTRRTTTNSSIKWWEWHVNNSTRNNSSPNHRGSSSIRFVAMATSIPIQIRWKPATRAWNHIHRLASTSSSTASKPFEGKSKNQSLLVLDVSGIYECQITGPNKNPTETLEGTNDNVHDPEHLLGWMDRMTNPQPLLYTNHQPYIRAGCRYDLSSILSPSTTSLSSSLDDDSSWTDPIRNSIFVKCRWCQPNVECQLLIHPRDKDTHNPTRLTWVPSGTCRLRWEKDHSYHPSPNIRLDMGISTEKQRFMQFQMGFFRNRNPTKKPILIQSPRIIVRHKTLWDGQLLSNNIHDPNHMDDQQDSKDDNNSNHHHHQRHKIHPDSWIPNFQLTTSGRLEVSNTIRWRDNDQGRIHIRWSRSLPGGSSSSSSMDNGGWWWPNLFHDDDDNDKEHSWTHCHLEVRHKVSNSYHLGTVSLVCQGFLESFKETCQMVVSHEQTYPIGQ